MKVQPRIANVRLKDTNQGVERCGKLYRTVSSEVQTQTSKRVNARWKLYLCLNMGYAKERGKFETLLTKVSGLQNYDDKSRTIINDIYDQYSHSVRILKNKNPEAFNELFQNELQQVKLVKKSLKLSEEADGQDNFVKFRDALLAALNSAITGIKQKAKGSI